MLIWPRWQKKHFYKSKRSPAIGGGAFFPLTSRDKHSTMTKISERIYDNGSTYLYAQHDYCPAARRFRTDFAGLVLSYPNSRVIQRGSSDFRFITVQVEGTFDLHRFYFLRKEAGIMPEQSVHHQGKTDSDQQTNSCEKQNSKEITYGNHRHNCTGRIQCRN